MVARTVVKTAVAARMAKVLQESNRAEAQGNPQRSALVLLMLKIQTSLRGDRGDRAVKLTAPNVGDCSAPFRIELKVNRRAEPEHMWLELEPEQDYQAIPNQLAP